MLTFILYIDWGIWIQKQITHRSFLSCFCSFWNNVSIIGFFFRKIFSSVELELGHKKFLISIARVMNKWYCSIHKKYDLSQPILILISQIMMLWFWNSQLIQFHRGCSFYFVIRCFSNNRYKTISNQIFSEYFHYLFCIFLDTVKLFDMLGGAKIYRS